MELDKRYAKKGRAYDYNLTIFTWQIYWEIKSLAA